MKINFTQFKKYGLMVCSVLCSTLALISCSSSKLHSTGINSQTQRVDTQLKRTDYKLMENQFTYTVTNKKQYKRYNLDELKQVAFTGAERSAINAGADGVLNPVFAVEQKRKVFIVTARVKGYQLKTDNDYLNMENSLKHNPNSGR